MGKLIVYIILFIGILIAGLISCLIKQRRNNKIYQYYDDLKANGKKIIVPLQDCELKTREYYETVTSDDVPSRVEMLDALYDPNRLHKKVRKVVSVLVYRYTDQAGKMMEFRSEPIYMEVVNLRFLLEQRKQATIYYDAANWNRYYFDLGFLSA